VVDIVPYDPETKRASHGEPQITISSYDEYRKPRFFYSQTTGLRFRVTNLYHTALHLPVNLKLGVICCRIGQKCVLSFMFGSMTYYPKWGLAARDENVDN
jgi:hypothetical protein